MLRKPEINQASRMSLSGDLAPLQGILDQILGRIQAIEEKVGGGGSGNASSSSADDASESLVVVGYDKHTKDGLQPFLSSIESIPGLAKSSLGSELKSAWDAIRAIVVLASKCKKPPSLAALAPYLKPAQDSLSNIRKLRLDREFDNHIKAIMEMTACLGWVMIDSSSDPPSPTLFIKACIGSSDFWANKIRKQYKGIDNDTSKQQIVFCDTLKAMILNLVAYAKEYHMSSLAWNFNGIAIADFINEPSKPPTGTTRAVLKKTSAASGMGSIAAELAKKRCSTGETAATGLRKVTKEQQTWRQEFNKEAANPAVPKSVSTYKNAPKPMSSKKVASPPVFEYRDRGSKWAIEHQTKSTATDGAICVNVTDAKQHVYIYKCEDVTIQIHGKLNSIIMDACTKCNLVFDSVISSCEVVNCKKIQVQTTGICPSIAVDKTDGFTVYLSKMSLGITTFVTSKSSEMNVNFPDEGDEIKEVPIPEQFSHKLLNGVLRSEVSDLYH